MHFKTDPKGKYFKLEIKIYFLKQPKQRKWLRYCVLLALSERTRTKVMKHGKNMAAKGKAVLYTNQYKQTN